MRQLGILLTDMLAEDIVFPITDVDCKYRASAKFDDYILIEAVLTAVSKVKMVFAYRVMREQDGALLATGSTQNAFTNKQGKVIRLPDKYFTKLQASLPQ